jgi:histone H3/H4
MASTNKKVTTKRATAPVSVKPTNTKSAAPAPAKVAPTKGASRNPHSYARYESYVRRLLRDVVTDDWNESNTDLLKEHELESFKPALTAVALRAIDQLIVSLTTRIRDDSYLIAVKNKRVTVSGEDILTIAKFLLPKNLYENMRDIIATVTFSETSEVVDKDGKKRTVTTQKFHKKTKVEGKKDKDGNDVYEDVWSANVVIPRIRLEKILRRKKPGNSPDAPVVTEEITDPEILQNLHKLTAGSEKSEIKLSERAIGFVAIFVQVVITEILFEATDVVFVDKKKMIKYNHLSSVMETPLFAYLFKETFEDFKTNHPEFFEKEVDKKSGSKKAKKAPTQRKTTASSAKKPGRKPASAAAKKPGRKPASTASKKSGPGRKPASAAKKTTVKKTAGKKK